MRDRILSSQARSTTTSSSHLPLHMEQVYDPVLRQRWKHLCRRLHHLARAAVVHVYQAKRLGVLSAKGYKNITDKDETTDDPKKKEKMPQRRAKASTAARPKTASSAAASSSTPAKAYHVKYQTECPYPTFKRHGNRHGSFATCTACMARWKWDGRGWKQHGSSSKLSLPLPSFLTTVDGSIKPPGYTGETFLQLPPPGYEHLPLPLPLQALCPKATAPMMTAGPMQPASMAPGMSMATTVAGSMSKTGLPRSRPPSMTSSAAGHMKPASQMQDCGVASIDLEAPDLEETGSIYSWPPGSESDWWEK